MTKLEENLHQMRRDFISAIEQLADAAIEDRTTYQSAIDKLKQFKWNLTGRASSMMIDLAIELVEIRALKSTVERNH